MAVREGAGHTGYTVAKTLKSLAEGSLKFSGRDVVVVDEAAMVGTHHLYRLREVTTKAGVKTVLVGDAHQLGPVKARGGCVKIPGRPTSTNRPAPPANPTTERCAASGGRWVPILWRCWTDHSTYEPTIHHPVTAA